MHHIPAPNYTIISILRVFSLQSCAIILFLVFLVMTAPVGHITLTGLHPQGFRLNIFLYNPDLDIGCDVKCQLCVRS